MDHLVVCLSAGGTACQIWWILVQECRLCYLLISGQCSVAARVRTAMDLRISSRSRLPFQKSLNQGLSLLTAEMLMMDTMRYSARDILSHKTDRTTPKHIY